MIALSFNDYQYVTGRHAKPVVGAPELTVRGLELCEEAGEAGGKIKRIYRDDGGVVTNARKAAIAIELGDTLWGVARIAHLLGYTLEDIAQMNVDKLQGRADRGTLTGQGDNR
jgi:NTP pyrophosphatase (non-canonical NTP hydrolase)